MLLSFFMPIIMPIVTNFLQKWWLFVKTSIMLNFLHKCLLFWVTIAIFSLQFFCENISFVSLVWFTAVFAL
jgi:hypothetical protein